VPTTASPTPASRNRWIANRVNAVPIPWALHQRVDRQHVDLAGAVVGVDPHGDVPDRPPVLFGDLHRCSVVLAYRFHSARLCR
jgi:hypothetical protein